ncbi:hypothetical protein E4U19_002587 [Claviceps sp. Clav32 group G5]|nr:hypothetical protein E4U19_002587 [Claviceps sp. Clav32 group G5]
MHSTVNESLYVLQDIPGKGKGLVATRNIPKGTRIISEQALFTILDYENLSLDERKRLVCQQFDALSRDEKDTFMSLDNTCPFNDSEEQCFGIFITSRLHLGDGLRFSEESASAGIFPETCRINHDCESNAYNVWNENIERHTVHAIRDIRSGEEITMNYVSNVLKRKVRQTRLQESFGFTCSCRICSLPEAQSQQRDRMVETAIGLDKRAQAMRWESPLEALSCCRTSLMCHNSDERREDADFVTAYGNTAQLFILHGDLARARFFAGKAAAVSRTIFGNDNETTVHFTTLALDPSRHSDYGVSMKWKTAVDEQPQGLGPVDLENWLWEKQFPVGLAGFAILPFNFNIRTGGSPKKRHWCFLGQILDIEHPFEHLVFSIRDMYGEERPLHFCTEEGGREFTTSPYQKGYTVAVIDAVQYPYKFKKPGSQCPIRLEDPRMIKVFPLSLAKMLAMGDQFRRFAIRQHNNLRKCHGCGTNAAADAMKRCGICFSVWYCNKECQIAGWTTKKHKSDCKFLNDPDLRALFLFRWDEAQVCDGFPLRVADDFC